MKGCRPFSDAEVQAVTQALARDRYHARNLALFHLGVRSGFRISELLSLKLQDVFQNGNFVESVMVARRHMKGKNASRGVPLHPDARVALEVWVRELLAAGHADPGTFLFRSREGGNRAISRKTAWYILRKVSSACGLTGKIGTHSLRKTFAKRVYEKLGRDLMKTQRALGHARVTSTVSYLSFDQGEVEDAILKS